MFSNVHYISALHLAGFESSTELFANCCTVITGLWVACTAVVFTLNEWHYGKVSQPTAQEVISRKNVLFAANMKVIKYLAAVGDIMLSLP